MLRRYMGAKPSGFAARCMRVMRQRGVAAAAMVLLSAPALATGFFLNQQSVQGLGRTDAGNAVAANDPSTVYYNPAGMALLVGAFPPERVVFVS